MIYQLTQYITLVFSVLTLLSDIFIIGIILLLIARWGLKKPELFPWLDHVLSYVKGHVLLFSFIVALVATLGSLYYSEIGGYNPCELCWFQRIFIYPQVLLYGIALWKKDLGVLKYGISLAVVGFIISAYHYFIQIGSALNKITAEFLPCSVVGHTPACSQYFVFRFGYITIPMMALTVSALLLTFAGIYYKVRSSK